MILKIWASCNEVMQKIFFSFQCIKIFWTKKEIEKWIEAFNPEQVERMRADNYLDYIDESDLNGS